MGAVTLANATQGVIDNKRTVEVDVTFSSSYATGGDSLSNAALGLVRVDDVTVLAGKKSDGTAIAGHGAHVVLAGTGGAPLLKLFLGSSSEVAGASSNTGTTVRLRFFGK